MSTNAQRSASYWPCYEDTAMLPACDGVAVWQCDGVTLLCWTVLLHQCHYCNEVQTMLYKVFVIIDWGRVFINPRELFYFSFKTLSDCGRSINVLFKNFPSFRLFLGTVSQCEKLSLAQCSDEESAEFELILTTSPGNALHPSLPSRLILPLTLRGTQFC